ncbi:MAG: autotransporter-associated beta strand repeat-containing protein [Akkermansia sp.]|nr:autotransporter-associated beta strand repeat-containing protein [Akkermansia sp.]
MKLHLNLSLRRALLAAMAAVATFATTATAGVMHSDATYQTYTDFGQNCGRYVVGGKVNDLLSEIRKAENGIAITYTDGTPAFVISNEQGMINYSGTHDSGHSTVIAPTFIATVLHNGSLDGSFSERTVGQNYAINYDAIDIRGSQYFRLAPEWGNGQYDYMLQRQSKVVTDVTWNSLTSLTYEQIENLDGGYVYHSGSGTMYQWDEENEKMVGKAGPYTYIIGAINNITNGQVHADGENFSIHQNPEYVQNDGASEANPLPNGIRPGDSGSPTFIYNTATGQYEYIAAQQSAGAESYGQARGNVEWTQETLKAFDVNLDMSGNSTIHLGKVEHAGETISETIGSTTYSTTLYSGKATNAAGVEIGSYVGVLSGTNTWRDYNGRKNQDNWYAAHEISWKVPGVIYEELPDLMVSDEDLFYTQNLVFSSSQKENNIILDATVDLGIGYAEFSKAGDIDKAVYTISSDTAGTMFNHAGYVINKGAEVHLQLVNTTEYMTEWRKIGEGDLYIDGVGDTNALLNLGGSGKTYLQQKAGGETPAHAAYNVLINSGATVVIGDTNQIERDLTFGAGGGTLDMNGNSMDWYTSGGENREGSFTIQALTEEAMIINSSSQASNLTYRQGGNTTYKGSFSDATGKLNITYAGGGTWTLNSIHTNLSQSTFTVSNGKVVLSGVNTVHGMGSATATNTNRLMLENDWHYADANMYIEIESGAAFELGSHARLQGDVWAKSGSTFILREGVQHQYEYVEGGSQLVDTYGKLSETSEYRYSDFYGLHANSLKLESGASLQVEYSQGTTANTTVATDIYGKGAVSVDTGLAGGTLTLAGNNSFSGKKTVISGGLIAEHDNALGNTGDNKWLVQEKGWIASHVHKGETLLEKVDTASTGVLALSANTAEQLDLSGHKNLSLGAESGKTIEYGAKGTTEELQAVDGSWRLGGGGGTLNVNFVLADGVDAETGEVIKHDLIVGNAYSSGTVHLANENNSFSGIIYIKGTGNLLTYESLDALGDARVSIEYGNILALHKESDLYLINADTAGEDGTLSVGAKGILATVFSFDLDISNYSIALGAVGEQTYTSKLTVDEAKGYRLGGSGSLIMDTTLDCSSIMQIDGQGNSGSSVTFAREHAYTGSITAGGMLEKDNMTGDIGIHAGYGNTFASVTSMELQKGAILYTDGHADMVVHNLSARNDSSIRNNGTSATNLELNITEASAIGDNVLADANNSAGLTLIKTGEGTLSMGSNNSWSGGLVIAEGKVIASAGASGIGAAGASIHVEKGASLSLTLPGGTGYSLGSGLITQVVTGKGIVEISAGKSVVFSQQSTAFEGTIKLDGNTRMYVGNMNKEYNNLGAFNSSTVIDVAKGSQVRVTNSLRYMSTGSVETSANFAIEGTGFAGSDEKDGGGAVPHAALNIGALSIDCGAVVLGNVTLNGDATIASWSSNPLNETAYINISSTALGYGVKEKLGGTIRGLILGVDKDLTIAGNESMTITADSANDFRNLIIDNKQLKGDASNGSNTDKFALRLDGGKAVSQVSTALGTGQVDLRSNLILRLAGTGTPGQSDVVYTYDNAIMAGDNATLQSYNITNELTNQVIAGTGTLNLATAEGGVLHLAGGVSGTGLLNIAAGSDVRLGGVKSTFMGDVQAVAGTKLTLDSYKALGSDSSITGIDSLTLCLGNGGGDYSLGGIRLEKSADSVATALTLRFDFTDVPDAGNTDSWSSLATSIKTDSLLVGIDLNMYNDIQKGDYVLIDDIGDMAFSLVEGSNDRLSLTNENGKLVLHVAPDGRLIWTRGDGSPHSWDAANWYSEEQDKLLTHTAGTDVLLSARSVDGAPSGNRESIELRSDVAVGSMMVRDVAYGITGDHKLTGKELCVGSGADLKLSTAQAAFTDGVLVNGNGTSLSVEGSELKAEIVAEDFAKVSLKDSTFTGDILATNATVSMDASSAIGEMTLSISELEVANQSRLKGNVNLSYSSVSISDSELEGNIVIGKTSSVEMKNARLKGKIQLGSEGSIITARNSNDTANSWATLSGNLGEAGSTTLAVSSGSLAITGKVSLASLSMADNETVRLHNDSNNVTQGKRIDRLELGRNGTLEVYNTTGKIHSTIGTLQVKDVATVTEMCDSGYLKIDTLELAEGSANSTLKLHKASNMNASWTSIYELGSATAAAGNFAGAVELSNLNAKSGNLSVFMTLAGKDILADAVVKMNTQNSANGYLGLGIMADGATIGGLESSLGNRALLFSGESQQNTGWSVDGEKHKIQNGDIVRTMVIDTDTGTDYTFNGRVLNNLNIVKMGEGSQTFDGVSTGYTISSTDDSPYNFNGSIELQEGTLIFGKDAIGMLTNASSVTISGGTLDISSYDFNTSDGGLELNNFTFSENAVLALGNLNQGTTYEFFGSSGIFLTNWTDLTTDNFSINGVSLSDMGRVNLVLNMGGSFSYTIDSWDLTWQGGSNGTWDMTSEVWQTTRQDDSTGEESTFNTGFSDGDNVTFTNGGTATLGSDILVSTVNVDSGTVVIKDAGSYAFKASTINVADNAHLQLCYTNGKAAENNTISKLVLEGGAHFSTYDENQATIATAIGSLQVNGATVTVEDAHNSGIYHINTLALGDGLSTATLNLEKKSPSSIVTVFQLGSASANAGNFTGTINLKSTAKDSASSGRPAAIILSNKDIAAQAVIKLESNTSAASGSLLALGINADNTCIAGLESGKNLGIRAKLFSGSIGASTSQQWNTSNIINASTRTLTINTAEGAEGGNHTFYGEVMSINGNKLNLVKEGKGTQSFLGSGSFGSVTVKGGTLTLGGSMTVEVSNANRTFDVAQNAKLNISSSAIFTNTGDVKLNKKGAGTMTVNSKISQYWLDILTGTFEVGYTGDDGNNITNIDAGISGTATGQVLVKKGAQLNSTTIWMRQGTIALEESGMLNYKGATIIGEAASGTAIIERTNKNDGGEYTGLTDSKITISGARVKSTVAGATISNKLTNSSVENAGGGTLTVSNSANKLTGIHATGGNINVAAAASLELDDLVIKSQKSVTAATAVCVDSLAQFESGATLNADLTLATGATVKLGGEDFTLNGALTLQTGLTLGGNALEAVKGLAVGESYTLFSGVTNLQLGQAVTLNNMRSLSRQTTDATAYEALVEDTTVEASKYFANLSGYTGLVLSYNSTDGSVSITQTAAIPEPATTTLSLLALSALAARRRRK